MVAASLMILLLQQQQEVPRTETAEQTQKEPANARSVTLNEQAQAFIRDVVLIAIPAEFDDDKHWGRTIRIQSGLDVKLDGGRVRTNRRWKDVRHGQWKKYHVRLIDPEERLQLSITNVVRRPGKPYQFDVECAARLRTEARFQEWQFGIPVLRLSAVADADVRLRARCELGVDVDASSFPPAVQLKPVVHTADVRLGRFRVRRISHLKGTVAEQFSDGIRAVLKAAIADRRRDLPKKLNRKLQKKEDDLRISLGEWLKFSGEKSAKKDKKASTGA